MQFLTRIVSLLPVLHCYGNGCYEKHSRLQSSGRLNLIPKLLCSEDSRGSQLESEGKTRVMLVGRLEALQPPQHLGATFPRMPLWLSET